MSVIPTHDKSCGGVSKRNFILLFFNSYKVLVDAKGLGIEPGLSPLSSSKFISEINFVNHVIHEPFGERNHRDGSCTHQRNLMCGKFPIYTVPAWEPHTKLSHRKRRPVPSSGIWAVSFGTYRSNILGFEK